MIDLTWQDWVTIVSLAIGILSLVASVWGLVNTGLIKKAVKITYDKLMNRLKYITHRVTYLNSIKNIKDKLSLRKGFTPSSDQIKELSFKMEETVKWLKDCNMHFSKEDKKKTEEIATRLEEFNGDQHITFDNIIGNELRSFSQDLFILLSKEDYYL